MPTRILIIDDEPRWLKFTKDNLGMTFKLDVATNLEMALEKLRQKRYDLIIASSRRVDVLEAITEKYPEKPVVVTSAQPTTREAIYMYRLGALDYFAKDFRHGVVFQNIRAAIQKVVKAPA